MKKVFLSLGATLLLAHGNGEETARTLWNRCPPNSLLQILSIYQLYPTSTEGELALLRAAHLVKDCDPVHLSTVIRQMASTRWTPPNPKELESIHFLSQNLGNRRLKGFSASSEEEVLNLHPSEIDLGRALLLSQLPKTEDSLAQIENYCAYLDVMALKVLSRLTEYASAEEKIWAMNQLIFEEMKFRFPPHSIYAKDVDLYTFLPSVMDNHLGVCLGVAALYLAIAQRIDLPLEAITPPGHIYLRYRTENKILNIETTARGIDLPTEHYLTVNTPHLEVRTIKEVIGMTHVNQASLYLQQGRFDDAAKAYEKALLYMAKDPLIYELLGLSYLFIGKEEEAKELFKQYEKKPPLHVITRSTMPEDFLKGKIDAEGLKVIFDSVDENRSSIAKKLEKLQEILKQYPEFREGLLQTAVAWIQLNRPKEALVTLEKYHAIDPANPVIEYYLSVLQMERQNFPAAWHYLKIAQALVGKKQFSPKALKELCLQLMMSCPETL